MLFPLPVFLKTLLIYGFQLFLLISLFLQKLTSFPFWKRPLKSPLLSSLSLRSVRKSSSRTYITLRISEKIKKKKIKVLAPLSRRRDCMNVLTKRTPSNEASGLALESFARKYNDFYNDLPLSFQQLCSSRMRSNEEGKVQTKIKEPFFDRKAKILSSTDLRIHDYKDLNQFVGNICLGERRGYENEEFSRFLVERFGRKMNFSEIYDLYYRRSCADRKCGCTRSFLKMTAVPMVKKKPEARGFLAIKLTPVLENIEYI